MAYKVEIKFYDEIGCLSDIGWFVIFTTDKYNPAHSIYDIIEKKIAPIYDTDHYTFDVVKLTSDEFIEIPQDIFEEL